MTEGRGNLIFEGSTTANITGSISESSSWGLLEIEGSANVTAGSIVYGIPADSYQTGEVILNGGTLTTGSIAATERGTGGTQSLLVLNGTQINSSASSSTFIAVTTDPNVGATANEAYIGVNGLLVNTEGFNDTITATLNNLTTTQTSSASLSGILSAGNAGTGFLTKTGSGTLTLSAANTYTGTTTVGGGTLALGIANAVGSSSVVTVTNSGTLALGNFSDTVAGVHLLNGSITGSTGTLTDSDTNGYDVQSGSASAILAGTHGLTKTTTGTVTLSGANTYTGSTSINAGTLIVNGSLSGASAAKVTVNGGGTLGGTGTIGGAVTVAGGTSAPNIGSISLVNGSIGTLTINGGLTVGATTSGSNSNLLFEAGSSTSDLIQLGSGTLTVNAGGAKVTITNLGVVANNTYQLIEFGSGNGVNLNGLTLTNSSLSFGVSGSLQDTSNSVELVTSGSSAPATAYWTGSQGTSWNSANTVGNFSTDSGGVTGVQALPAATTDVYFSATGATNLTNSLGQTFDIKGLFFNGTPSGAVNVTDSSNSLTLEGDGINDANNSGVTLSPSNLVSNTNETWTNSSTGTLTVSSTVSTTTNATLTLANTGSGPTALNGVISNGTGTLSLTVNNGGIGTGSVILGAANTFTGTTTITSGALQLGTNNALQNSTVALNETNGLTFSPGVGTFNIAALIGSSNEQLNATNSSVVALNIGGTNASSTFAGGLTGGGSLIKSGSGTLTLSGSSSYTGSTAVNAGALNLQSNGALGSTSSVTVTNGAALQLQGGISDTSGAALTLNGTGISGNGALENVSGTNTYSGLVTLGSAATIGSDANTLILSNAGTITGSGALTLAGAGNGTVNSIIGSSGGLTQSGTGTWTLAGNNTYTGSTAVSAGTLILSGNNTSATGATSVAAGATLQLANANALAGSAGLTLNGNLSGTGSTLQLRGNAGTNFAMGTGSENSVAYNVLIANGLDKSQTYTVDVGANGGTAGMLTIGTVAYDAQFDTAGGNQNYYGTLSVTNSNSDGTGLTINKIVSPNNSISKGSPFPIGDNNYFAISSSIANLNIGSFTGDTQYNNFLALSGSGNITFTGALNLVYSNNGQTSQLVLNQTGTVTLQGSDSFGGGGAGTITDNSGILVLDNNNALSGDQTTITVGSSGNNPTSILLGGPGFLTGGITMAQAFQANSADTGAITFGGQNTSGTNTFSGNITVGANTTALLAATGGAVKFSGNILANGSTGVTVGNGSSAGTVILTGANTYTGTTSVNGGTLVLAGVSTNVTATTVASGATLNVIGTTGAGAMTIKGGATLGGTGTIGGAVTVANNGNVTLTNSPTQVLNINGGLTVGDPFSGASNLNFAAGSGTASLIQLGAGTFTVNAGGANITITNLGVVAGNTYQLIDYGSAAGAGFSMGEGTTVGDLTLTDPNLSFGVTGMLVVTTNAVELVTNTAAPATAYWTGSQGTTWVSNNGAMGNFSTDSGGLTGFTGFPASTTDVYFAATGATNLGNNLGQNFDIKGLTFLATDAGTNTIGAVNITDSSSSLTIEGDGITDSNSNGVTLNPKTLIANASQTWTNNSTGTMTVSAPVSGAATTGNTTTLNVANANTGPTYLNGVIGDGSNGGQLALNVNSAGAGAVVLGAANTYSGATTINAGTLLLGNANALQDSTVAINTTNGLLFSGGIGAFNVAGLSGSANEALSATNSTVVSLNVGGTNTSSTYSGGLTGIGNLTKLGTGTLTLSGSNSYTGSTAVNAGTLILAGASTNVTATTVNGGATLNVTGSTGAGTVSVNSGAILGGTGTIGGAVTVAGATSGTGGTISLPSTTQTLTINGGLMVGGSSAGQLSNLNFAAGPGSASSIQLGAGTFTVNPGGADINITNLGISAGQTYDLINYGAGAGSGFTTGTGTTVGDLTLTDPTLALGVTGSLDVTGNEVELVTASASAPATAYWTGSQGATWNAFNGGMANFSTDSLGVTGVSALPGATTDVIFAATGATNLSNSLGQNFNIKGLNFLTYDAHLNTIAAVNITDSSSTLTIGGDGITDSNILEGVNLSPKALILNTSQNWISTASTPGFENGFIVNAPVAGTATAGNTTTLTLEVTGYGGPIYLNGAISDGTGGGQLALNINNGYETSAVVLGAANTYTGATTINAGTLEIGNANALQYSTLNIIYGGASQYPVEFLSTNISTFTLGGLSGSVNLAQPDGTPSFTLQIGNNNTNTTYSGGLSGPLSLVKIGTGTLTLSGVNTYRGGTTINAGTLLINGGQSNAVLGFSVNGGATLGGTGAIVGSAVTVAGGTSGTGGTISLPSATQTFIINGGLAVGGSSAGQFSNLNFAAGSGTASLLQLETSTFTVNAGGAAITIANLGIVAGQTYQLIDYGSGTGAGFAIGTGTTVDGLTLTDPLFGNGITGVLDVTGSAVELVTSSVASPATAYWTGSQGTSWTANNGLVANFSTDAAGATSIGAYPSSTTDVIFAATGAKNLSNSLGQNFDIKGLTFLATDAGSNTIGAVNITDSSDTLAIGSDGITNYNNNGVNLSPKALILNASQTWLSTSSNTSGTLYGFTVNAPVSGSAAAGQTTTLTLEVIGAGQPFEFNGVISDGTSGGQLALNINTGNFVVLGAANTYTGATTINSGELFLDNTNALQYSTLYINSADTSQDPLGFGGGIYNFTLGGLSGSLNLFLANGNGPLRIGNNNTNTTYSGNLGGPVAIVKVGTGTLTLSGNNSYLNGTTVNGGTLILSGSNSYSGSTAVNAGTLLVNGNQSSATGAVSVNAGATLGGTGTIGGAVTVAGGASGTGGTISLPSAPQTLTLNGGLTVGGNSAGQFSNLNFAAGSASSSLLQLGTGTFTVNSGGAGITITNLGIVAGQTYQLVDYGTGTGAGFATGTGTTVDGLTLTDPSFGNDISGVLDVTGNGIELITSYSAPAGVYWTGSQGSSWTANNGAVGNFSTDASGNTAALALPNNTTDVAFAATGATNLSNSLGQNFDIKGITFLAQDAGSNTIGAVNITDSSSSLTIEGDGITNFNKNGVALNPTALVANVSQAWANNSTGTLTISSPVSATTNTTLTVTNSSSGPTALNGIISNGTGTLSLAVNGSGSGAVILGAANTYTGATTLAAGATLQLANANALQNSALTMNGNTSGTGVLTLQLRGNANTTFNMGTQSTNGVSNNILINNGVAGNNTYTIDVGAQSGGSAGVMTLGTVVFSSSYNYNISTNFQGTLNATNSDGDGSGLAIGAIVSSGIAQGTGVDGNFFTINSAISNTNGLTIGSYDGSDSPNSGQLVLTGAGNTTFTGGVTGAVGLNLILNQTGTVTFAGTETLNAGTLNANSGTTIISGANTYTGATNIGPNGTLQLANANALQDSAVTMYGTSGNGTTQTLQLRGNGNTTFNMGSQSNHGVANSIYLDNVNYDSSTFTIDVGAVSGGSPGTMSVGTVTWANAPIYGAIPTLNITNSSLDGSNLTIAAIASDNQTYVDNGSDWASDVLTINSTISNLSIGSFTGQSTTNGTAFFTYLTLTGYGNTMFTGNVVNGGGNTLSLIINQSGTITLEGADSFNGGNVSLNAGTLVLDNNNALSGAANPTTLGSTTATPNNVSVLLGDAGHSTGGLTISQSFQAQNLDTGTLTLGGRNTSGTNTFSGNVILGATTNTGKGVTLLSATGGEVAFTGNILANGTSTAGLTVGNGLNAGTVLLSGANTYTGTTSVNAGTLVLAGASTNVTATTVNSGGTLNVIGSTGAGAVSVNGGAILGGSGTIGGAVTVSGGTSGSGGTINMTGSPTQALAINGGLTVGGTAGNYSNLNFVANGGTSSLLQLGTGTFTVNAGGADITINNLGIGVNTTYQLINFGAGAGSGFATGSGAATIGDLTLTNPNIDFGVAGTLTVTGSAVELVTTGAAAPTTAFWTGSQGASWNSNNGVYGNFSTDAGGVTGVQANPGAATDVYFAATGATNLSNSLGKNFDIKGLSFLAQDVGSNTIASVNITDASSTLTLEADALTDANNNGVTLNTRGLVPNGSQTWTNSSTGTLTISAPVSATTNTTLTLANTNSGPTALTGFISNGTGTLGLTVNNGGSGTGAVVLGAANTFTGTTTIASGSLQLGTNNALQNSVVSLGVANGLLFSPGVGTFTVAGLTGNSNESLADTSNHAVTLQVGNTNASSTYSGSLTGSGNLTQTGTGTFTLTGSNSYTGSTAVNAGALDIQNSGALGATSGVSVSSGAALQLQGGISTSSAAPLTLNGAGVSGNGALESVSGNNTYSGLVSLGSSVTIGSDINALTLSNAGTITGSGDTLTLAGAGNGAINSAIATGFGGLTMNGTGTWTLAGNNSYSGVTTISAGTLILSGANTTSGVTSVNAGATLQVANANALQGSALAMNGSGAPGATETLQLRGNGNTTFNMGSQSTNGLTNNIYLNNVTYSSNVFTIDVGAASGGSAGTMSVGTLTWGDSTYNNAEPTLNVTNSNGDGSNLTIAAIASDNQTYLDGGNDWSSDILTINSAISNLSIGSFTGQSTNGETFQTLLTITGPGNTTFTGNIVNGGSNALYLQLEQTGTVTLAGSETLGNGGVFYIDSGTTIISGANTFSNVTTVNQTQAGANIVLQLTNANALQNSPLQFYGDDTGGSSGVAPAGNTQTLQLRGNGNTTFAMGAQNVNGVTANIYLDNFSYDSDTFVIDTGAKSGGSAGVMTVGTITWDDAYNNQAVTTLGVTNSTGDGSGLAIGAIVSDNKNQFSGDDLSNALTINSSISNSNGFTIGRFTGSYANASALTLTGTGNTTFTGAVVNGSGRTLALIDNQSGTVTLEGADSFNGGAVAANAGTLVLDNSSALSGAASQVTFGSTTSTGNNVSVLLGDSSHLTGGLAVAQNFQAQNADTGTLTLGGQNTSGIDTFSGNVTLGATANTGKGVTLLAATGGEVAFTGNILANGTSTAGITVGNGSNAGTVALSGTNTYTGSTAINAGTLDIGGSGTLGSGNYQGNIANSGSLIYNSSSAQTLSGQISGAGSLTQSGSGTLTLSGNNGYTGSTAVNAGTLLVNGNQSSATGAVSVTTGATLGGAGIIGGATTVAGGGNINLSTSATQTLTFNGGLTVGGSSAGQYSNLNFVAGAVDASSISLGGGTFTVNAGGADITVASLGLVAGQNYDLIDYGAGAGSGFAYGSGVTVGDLTLTDPNLGFGLAGSLTVTGTAVELVTTGANLPAPATAYWTGSQGATWTANNGAEANFSTDSAGATSVGAYPSSTTDVIFAATGAGNLSNSLGQNFDVKGLTFLASDAGSNPIGAVNITDSSSSLTVEGDGITDNNNNGLTLNTKTLVANVSQTWANNSSGTLTIDSPVTGGNTNTTLNLSYVDPGTYYTNNTLLNGVISDGNGGVLSLTINGSGSEYIALTAANTFSGAATINSGLLEVGNSNALQNSTVYLNESNGIAFYGFSNIFTIGGLAGSGNFGSGSNPITLQVGNNNTNTTYSGDITGPVSLTKIGTGTLTLTASNGYTGATTISSGTLQLGNGTAGNDGSISSTSGIVDNATLAYDNVGSQNNSVAISGSGGLTMLGTGTLFLSANETYTGATQINSGTLEINDINLPNSTLYINTTNGLTFNPGTEAVGLGGLAGGANESLVSLGGGPVSLYVGGNNTNTTYSGNLSGGLLFKTGTGTLTLTGNNSFYGPTKIQAGALNIQSNGALVSSSNAIVYSGAALQLQGGISTLAAAPLLLAGSGPSGNGALENVSGNNTYSSLVTLNSSAALGSDTNTLILSNTATIGGSGNLTLVGAGNGTVDGGIGTGSGGLTMSGTGTWTLAGNNTYTGATAVNAGTLILSGANTATGVTSVAVGATLQLANANALQDSALTMNGNASGTGAATLQLRGNAGTTFNLGTQYTNGVPNNIFLNNGVSANNTFTFDVGANGGAAGVLNVGTITYNSYYSGGGANEFATLNVTNSNGDGSGLAVGAIKADLQAQGSGIDSNNFKINSSIANLSVGSFTGDSTNITNLFLSGTGNTTLTGTVGGAAGVTFADTQTGTVTLQGGDTFNRFLLYAGTLVLDNNNALGGLSGTQTVGTSSANNISVLLGDANYSTGGLTSSTSFQATNLDTGTITFGGQNTSGTNTFSGNITLGASANTGKDVTLLSATGGVVAFTGNILQNGASTAGVTVGNGSNAGTVVLSGTNTYTGATAVNAGTLILAGASTNVTATTVNSGGTLNVIGSTGAGAVSVNGGATLGGTGTIGGAVTVATGGNINLSNNAGGTLTINGGLTVGGNSAGQYSNLDFTANGSSSTLIQLGTGTFTVNAGGVDITLAGVGFGGNQTYELIDYGAGAGAGFGIGTGTTVDGLTLTDPSLGGGISGYLEVTGNEVELVTTGATAPGTAYWTGSQGTNWSSNNGVDGNFSTDSGGITSVQTVPGNTTDVYFAATGATNLGNSLGQNFDIKGLTFLATDAGSNPIGAVNITDSSSTLTVEGDGITDSNNNGVTLSPKSLIADASQTWTNNSTGTLTISAPVTGSSTNTTLTVTDDSAAPTNLNGTISNGTGGALSLTVNGTGAVLLGAANTFSGTTSIVSGTLQLGNANALQDSTVALNTTNGLTFSPGVGTFTLGGLSGGASENLAATNASVVSLNVGGNNASSTYSGGLSGGGSLTKIGTGTLTLSGNNSYTGSTSVNGGTLILSGANTGSGVTTLNGTYGNVSTTLQLIGANALQDSSLTVNPYNTNGGAAITNTLQLRGNGNTTFAMGTQSVNGVSANINLFDQAYTSNLFTVDVGASSGGTAGVMTLGTITWTNSPPLGTFAAITATNANGDGSGLVIDAIESNNLNISNNFYSNIVAVDSNISNTNGLSIGSFTGANNIASTLTLGGSGNTTFTGSVSGSAGRSLTLDMNQTGTVTFAGTETLNGGTFNANSGTTIISNANTFSGATTIGVGATLQLTNANALQNSAVTMYGTYGSGTQQTLQLRGNGNTTFNLGSQSTNGLSNNIYLDNLNTTGGSSTFTIDVGAASGGSAGTMSVGTVTWFNTPFYSVVPTLNVTNANGDGSRLTIAAIASDNQIYTGQYGGPELWASDMLTINSAISNLTIGSFTGQSTNASGFNSILTLSGAGNTTFTGAVTNGGNNTLSLVINQTGTVTFEGPVTLNGGTFSVDAGTLDLIGSSFANNSNPILVNGATMNLLASNQINSNDTVTVTNSGTFNFGSANQTLAGVVNNGGTVNYGTGITIIGDPVWSSGTNIISGNTTFTDFLTVSGGANTITGASSGGAGFLVVQGSGLTFSGTSSPNITINADSATPGELQLQADVMVDSSVTSGTASITSSGSGLPGVLDLDTAVSSAARNITVTESGAALNIGAAIKDTGGYGLNLEGAGTLILSGANTYTGSTSISSGTLMLGGSGTLGSGSYAGAISDNGTFNDNSSSAQTLSGAISGTGALVQSGTGTLTLSNATNSFGGGTTVSGGELAVTSSGALGGNTNSLSLSNSGIFDLEGTSQTVNTLSLGASTIQSTISGGTLHTGIVTVSGASTISSGATVSTGSSMVNIGSGGALSLNGGNTLSTTGTVTVNSGGSLIFGANNAINSGATIQGNGGLITMAGTSQTINSLTLASSSGTTELNLGLAGKSSLTASSGSLTGGILDINDWTGNTTGPMLGGTNGYFVDIAALSVSDLDDIDWTNATVNGVSYSGMGAQYLNGQLTPELTPVPEPSTVFGALCLLGLIGWRNRRQIGLVVAIARKNLGLPA